MGSLLSDGNRAAKWPPEGDGSRKSGEAIVQIAEDGSGVRAAFGGTLACCHFVEDRTEVRGILQTALPKLFPFDPLNQLARYLLKAARVMKSRSKLSSIAALHRSQY